MKKVRCLIGTVGAAVPVFGMVMPAAPAAAATHSAGPGTKTVSLRLAAATSSSSPASSPSRPGTTTTSSPLGASPSPATGSCTGKTKVHIKSSPGRFKPTLSTTFWYANAVGNHGVCIGTVEGTWWSYPDNPGYQFRIRIWSGTGKNRYRAHNAFVNGTRENDHTVVGGQGIHQWYGNKYGLPVQVCGAWVIRSIDSGGRENSIVAAGPQCKTVR